MNPHDEVVALEAGHCSEYCHAPEAVFNFPFEVKHADPATHAVVRLYHLRQDPWHDHFRVDTDTGVFEGHSAIGRATVARLEMNNPAPGAARQHWTRLGVFP
jgi:hypothetical protein